MSLSEIHYDPDIKNTIIAEDREMIEEYMEIWEDEINNNIDNISPWLLRLVLNKDYINIRMETIEEIIKKKAKKQGALIIHTRETSDEKKFHIRLECSNDMEQEKKQEYKSLDSLKYFENCLLIEISLCDIDSIKKVYVRNGKKVKYDENTGKLIPIKDSPEESVLEIDGTNYPKYSK